MNLTRAEAAHLARLREVCRRQHKAISTESCYAQWLRRYMVALRAMPLDLPSERKLERFLTDLAVAGQVSASTQNQAFNAICWFYADVLARPLAGVEALRAARGTRVRRAPTVPETQALLGAIGNTGGYPTNLVARLLYGCGLRVTEPLNLRIKDVQEDRLFIVGAKGRKDRVVALPCSLMEEVRGQIDFARAVFQRDAAAKIPVEAPEALSRKYPEIPFAWPWAWLFPAHQPCRHPRTGEWVRWRMHEANVQRAVKETRRRLGIMVLPHELRHAYATHCLDRGVNLKALQEAMGHEQIDTTIGYCHAEALSVRSPLEGLSLAAAARQDAWPGSATAGSHNAICEPFRVLELRALGGICTEKGSTELLTQELSRSGSQIALCDDDPAVPENWNAAPKLEIEHPAHARHLADRELVREAFAVVGAKAQQKHGGWYWNRIREDRSKFERVLRAVQEDKRDGARSGLIRNWGGHFFDLWQRFASHNDKLTQDAEGERGT